MDKCVAQTLFQRPSGGGLKLLLPLELFGSFHRARPVRSIIVQPATVGATLSPPPHLRPCLILRRALPLRFPLIVQLLPPRQRQLALDPPLLQVDLRRNQRQAFFARIAQQLVDLPPVQQQLAIAYRRGVFAGSRGGLACVGLF